MTPNVQLRIVSLLSLALFICHLTDDVLLQGVGAVKYPIPIIIFAVWLYGTLVLSERTAGRVIILLGGACSAGMIFIHSPGGFVPKTGGFWFIWTLFALSATGWYMMIESGRALWQMVRSRR